MVVILTLLPLSHPEPSQDALFGHFGIYPLLVTLDNSWNMDVIKMTFCHSSQNLRIVQGSVPWRKGPTPWLLPPPPQPLTVQPIDVGSVRYFLPLFPALLNHHRGSGAG